MSTYGFIDDLDIMEQQDAAFEAGRASLLDDPDDLTDDLLDLLVDEDEDLGIWDEDEEEDYS
jgi:hypothetical protein